MKHFSQQAFLPVKSNLWQRLEEERRERFGTERDQGRILKQKVALKIFFVIRSAPLKISLSGKAILRK